MKKHFLQFRTPSALAAGLLTANLALADNELWIGNPGVTTTTNWSDPNNWLGTSHSPNNNNVFFGNTYAVGSPGLVNNVVDLSTNCSSLNYTNSVGWNTTLIAAGQTLTIVGNNSGPALLFTPGAQTSNTNAITGANGTLLITGSSAGGVTVTVTNSGGTGVHPLLDLGGLGTLIISNAGSSAAINVGNSAVRPGGTLNLAMTNYIVLPASGAGGSAAIVVGEATGNNGSSPGGTLYLGITNAIFAGNIGVGLGKQSAATIAFNPAFQADNPVAYIRGPGGSAVTNWAIGDGINAAGTSIGPSGTVNFNGGTVNAVVSAMWLGMTSPSSAGTPTAKGTLNFNAGTISVVNLTNGCALTPTTGGPGAATGTINVSGTGTLAVNNLVLAFLGSGASSSTGTLNITNGTVAAGTIVGGGGNSTINLVAGTLYLTNTAGTSTQPLSSLYVSNATLQLSVSGSSAPVYATSVTTDGNTTDSNIINVATLPLIATYPTTVPLIQSSNPINLTGGNFNFALGTLPAPYQGYLSNNTANSSVDLVITNSLAKNDTWNGNVNSNLDTITLNWLYSGLHVNYQQGDSVTFDDTLTGTPNVVLATNVAPGAIGFNNSQTNYVLSGTNKITGATGLTLGNNNGSVKLTESGGDDFSGGITVNSGTLILDNPNSAITGGLLINGGTVQIGNNDANGALPGGAVTDDGALVFNRTDTVTVSTAIGGTGTLTQSGSGTLTLTGANSYGGNTTVGSGTLALSGSGTIADSAAVSVNNATFDVSALSLGTTLTSLNLNNAANTVAVSPSGSTNVNTTSLSFAGANRLNVSSLPAIASYPVTFTIIKSVNAASGSFSMSVGWPTATPPYAGNVTQSADQTAVLLTVTSGPVGARGAVFWSGADVPNLYTNWSDRLNWQLPGAPGPGDNVIFNEAGAQGASELSTPGGGAGTLITDLINNTVDANFTISSLTFTNVNGSYHNTLINDGLTLGMTNSGSLTVGSGSLDFGSTATEFVTIAGPTGTLNVNNTNGTLYVGLGSTNTGDHQATLDLSALGTFNAAVSRMLVGVGSASCGIPLARESGIVYLAQTNTITASLAVSGTETSATNASAVAFGIGDNDGNAGNTSCLYLGRTNAIFADAICIARQKQNAQMLFNPALIGLGPSAWFRGADGLSAVGTWSLGDGVVNGGSSGSTGVNDFTGGTVNALVNTMYVGRAANTTSGSGTSTGTLTFDDGVFNVGTLYAGYQPANSAKAGVGIVNVNSNATAGAGATLVVTGTLNLGLTTGGTGATNTSGTLNITNGTVQANTILAGGGTSTINLVGGTLIVTNTAGTTAAPLTALNLTTASLHLDVNPAANATNIVAETVETSGTTTITIDSISGPPASATFPLINYAGADPYTNLSLNPSLPAGYASGSLVDDTAMHTIDLTVSAAPPSPFVTNTADSGLGSLRDALAGATDGTTIDATGVSGMIVLTSGPLNVSSSVTILGPGPGALTVSGNNASGVFSVTGANVAISGLTIANGQSSQNGAGINAASSPGSVLTVSGCVITNNNTTLDGGGICNNAGVTMTVSNCTISGNSATGSGGGIYNDGTLTINATTLSSNSASVGGGIFNDAVSGPAALTVAASTLNNNSATYGGGIYNYGPSADGAMVTIVNSTLSGNSADGCIYNDGAWSGLAVLTINASTFSGNSGIVINNDGRFGGSATMEIGDTILNVGGPGANIVNADGTVTSAGYNLSSDDGGGFLTATGDQTNTAPMLGPLQNNGGPTWTQALLPGSPAIDQGNRAAIPALALNTDQRGFPRPVDNPHIPNAPGGDGSDIGAYETQFLSVTNTADSGPGTLRAALAAAGQVDIIDATGVSGTITLTNGQLTVSNSVTLLGPGAGALTVSGNNASRVFKVTGANVTISGLTIADGSSDTLDGAGIRASGGPGSVLTVSDCVVTNNNSLGNYGGGGIFNVQGVTMTITNCTISGNSATGSGGGIYNLYGVLTVVNSTLSGNSATYGGGIFNDKDGTLTVNASTFSGNEAGYGGGIYNDGATLTINACTFSGNGYYMSSYGGGICNSVGAVTINASTFSGNSAADGGGIWNESFTLYIDDTILNAGAAGGNIYNYNNEGTTVTSYGYNLSSDDSGSSFLNKTGDQNNTDPKLGPLANNGGPTLTLLPLFGSQAIDAGDDSVTHTFATDQRGYPRLSGAHVDIGAVEAQWAPTNHPPLLENSAWTAAGGARCFQFTFSNVTNADFTVLATTNLALPLADWILLAPAIQFSPGQYQFTDPGATNYPQCFYRVVSP